MIHCVILAQKDRERNQTFDMTITAAEFSEAGITRMLPRIPSVHIDPMIVMAICSAPPSHRSGFYTEDMLAQLPSLL